MIRAGVRFVCFVTWLAVFIRATTVTSADRLDELPADVLALVDAHARFRPTPLTKADDAFEVLEELQKQPVVEPSITKDRELYEAYVAVIGFERPFPDGELGERLLKLVNDNDRALKLFEQFHQRRGVRFPDVLKASGSELRQVIRIRNVQIARLLSQRKYDAATRMLFEHLRVGEMLQVSEGGLSAWLVGSNAEAEALHVFARLAADPTIPEEQIKVWQTRIRDLRGRSIEPLAQSLRRTYRDLELTLYAQLLAKATIEQAVTAAVGRHRPPPERFLINLRFTLREWQVLALLSEHPAPFDRDETIRLSSQRIAEFIRVLDGDRSRPAVVDEEEINHVASLWPESMGLDVLSLFLLHFGGSGWESWEAFWKEIMSAAKASEQLSDVPNAFGKYLIAMHDDLVPADALAGTVVRGRTRIEARLATLAIRRFERLHQRLPKSLQEVVDAKLLTELPRDPIDGQPLRYDPSRRLLWSIGLDGQDHGGIQRDQTGEKLFSMMRKLLPKKDAEKLAKPPASTAEPSSEGSDIVYSIDAK